MWIYYVDTRRRSKLKRGVSTSRYLVARCAAQSSDTQKICQILYVHHCHTDQSQLMRNSKNTSNANLDNTESKTIVVFTSSMLQLCAEI